MADIDAKDTGYASPRWEFDEEVTRVFDDMLERSIPQYETMRKGVFEIGSEFVQPKTAIVDLGCSRGGALAPFVRRFGAHNTYLGLEMSQSMLEASRSRFRGMIEAGIVEIREHDLRDGFPPVRSSLVLSVLTLQFVPMEYRHTIVREAYRSLVDGGALILVEKVIGASAKLDGLFSKIYHNKKRASGYSHDAIERKRLSLEGKLVPLTAEWNEGILSSGGFAFVECFWRWMNFAAWVAVKS